MNTDEVYNVLDLLKKSEVLGETVLRDRSEIVQLDRIRQKNREALSALKHRAEEDNVYLCSGNMFIKYRIKTARKLINNDQKNVNEHIEELRGKIKKNVEKIQEMEGKGEAFQKFNLNPLTQDEMKGFNVVLNSIKKLDLEN